jgi:hypothetical protein
LAAGVIALVLEANPLITWRDLRIILAQSARKNDPGNAEWTVNGGLFNINHNYGFGVADANAAVTLARTWVNVGAEVTFPTATATVNTAIPDNNATGISSAATVPAGTSGTKVSVAVNVAHTYIGDLQVTLSHGSQTWTLHNNTGSSADNILTTYTPSPAATGSLTGLWTLKVVDSVAEDVGTLTSWSVTVSP